MDTYNISEIYVYPANRSGMNISLQDHDRRRVQVSLELIQENQELWDLVYNGILTSLQNGNVKIKGIQTRRALGLPDDRNPTS